MMKSIVFVVLCSVLLSSCSSTGWRLKGDEFPKKYKQEHQVEPLSGITEDLSLRGVGVKTLFMVKVFIASLYLPSNIPSSDAMETDVPKHLSVIFYTKFSSKDFVNFTVDHMKSNLTKQEIQSLQGQLIEMKKFLPDIKKFDTFALSYNPNQGTSFILNGKLVGTVSGELFSKAIYSTWIGERPFDHIVKRQILGLK